MTRLFPLLALPILLVACAESGPEAEMGVEEEAAVQEAGTALADAERNRRDRDGLQRRSGRGTRLLRAYRDGPRRLHLSGPGQYLVTWVQRDGQWMVLWDIFNSDMPVQGEGG